MKKRVLALLVAVCITALFFVGCKPNAEHGVSSDITNSDTVSVQKEDKEDADNSSSKKDSSNSSTASTNSLGSSFLRPDSSSSENNADKWGDYDNFNTTSQTTSSGIKEYTQRLNIGIYNLMMYRCDFYGTDSASREKEFTEVVEQGFFNTYFLTGMLGQAPLSQILREVEIIAENGGTFWLGFNLFHSANITIEEFDRQKIAPVIDAITEAGYRDRLLGVTWDEPICIRGQANRDFLTQSELFYKKYGLRTFPVFTVDGFVGENGDINKFPGEKGQKIATEALKYVTDAGFDVYGVDVRKGAANGNRYESWSQKFGTTITNGKEYYIALKNLLKKRVDHKVNIWHFPTAFEWPTQDGGTADEEFCLAQLEFMAEDIMNDEYGGGLALYTYYRFTESHGAISMAQRLYVPNENGDCTIYPHYVKWYEYSRKLMKIRAQFSSKKANLIDLGL